MIAPLILCTALALAADDELSAAATVPNLKGQPPAVTAQIVHLADLTYAEGVFYIAPQNWRDDIQPGAVYMQTPQPGMIVPAGSVVACWKFMPASTDRPLVNVPDLRGQSAAQAQEELTTAGLPPFGMPSDLGEKSESEPQVVADQFPHPGQSVYQGTSVYLLLTPDD